MSNTQKEMPEWFDGKKINEILFCEAFRKEHPMICINGRFFTVDGLIADPGKLEAEIFNTIHSSGGRYRSPVGSSVCCLQAMV